MEKTIPFKNIIVSDDIDSVVKNRQLPTGTVFVITCKQGGLRVDTGEDESYELHRGDVMLCMPDFLLNKYVYSSDFQCLMFSVQPESLNDTIYSCLRVDSNWFDKLQYVKQHPIIHLNDYQVQLFRAYENLISLHIQQVGPYQEHVSEVLAQAVVFEILYLVETNMHGQVSMKKSFDGYVMENKSRLDQLFYHFVQLLEANHSSRCSVCWYANQMAITPKYLTYICKQVTGKTPTEIINNIAIREIKQVLLTTNDSVKEIAFSMNYSSASSFCKYFRQQTGMSPQAFRKQNKKKESNRE